MALSHGCTLFRICTGFLVWAMVIAPGIVAAQANATDPATRAAMMRGRPGDRVVVRVYGEPTLSGEATFDERGRIMLPRIGLIQADALPIAELRDTIRSRMATFLREPAVEVSVLRRIIVNGEVARSGVYYVELTATVAEAIAQAGGLKETAHPSKVYLVRGATRAKIENWQENDSPAADMTSGDQIVVGRRSWLALNIIPVVGVATSVVALIISIQTLRK
jgi:protein involved in polysaccharide export with SLBB domain